MPQYQGIWNLAQQSQALTTQQWVTDPLFKNTTLLLQADNTTSSAQNNLFLDSSPNQFAITRNGNTTQGSFTPFSQSPGWWSIYYGASNSDCVSFPTNAAYAIGTGNFTVEFWYNPSTFGTTQQRFFLMGVAGTTNLSVETDAAYSLTIGINTASALTYAWSPSIGTWYHIAVCRVGTTVTLYINGVGVATVTSSASIAANPINMGGLTWATGYNTQGYLSNVRFSANTAFYTSNFTPPTSPLTAVTGTVFLSAQNNRFVDNSSIASSPTIAGTPSVQAFSPFAPQYQYTPTVTGGSGYFDGSGDYLYTADNAALRFGAGNFTIEAVVYRTTSGATQGIIAKGDGGANTGWNFYITTANVLAFTYLGSNVTGAITIPANSWVYVAVVRSGTGTNQTTLYINGVADTSGTVTTNFNDTNVLKIASSRNTGTSGQDFWNGYIASLRMSNTNRTISGYPTAPLQSDANTTFLLNFTNAGIYDGALKETWETVGNAQVSTSVVKYGSGALYFPGTAGSYLINQSVPVNYLEWWKGEFTIEYWIYPLAFTQGGNTDPVVLGNLTPTTAGNYWSFGPITNGTVKMYYFNGAAQSITTTQTIPTGQWTHLAMVQRLGVVYIYINGVLSTSAAYSGTPQAAIDASNKFVMGQANNAAFNGYIDDVRITKAARYLRNFTPPTVALPRQ